MVLTTAELHVDLAELLAAFRASLQADPIGGALRLETAPSLLGGATAPAKVDAADAVILVVVAGRSKTAAVKEAASRLSAAETLFLGSVLTEARNPVPWFLRSLLGVA